MLADPQHEGRGGYTEAQVAAEIQGRLIANSAGIVLLHIGTDDLNPDPGDVEDILDNVDAYETSSGGRPVWVILARIVNRMEHICGNPSVTTTFNARGLQRTRRGACCWRRRGWSA